MALMGSQHNLTASLLFLGFPPPQKKNRLNSKLYYENKDFRKYVSLVPTSAHTGEGIPDLLLLLVQLTQRLMHERLVLRKEVRQPSAGVVWGGCAVAVTWQLPRL